MTNEEFMELGFDDPEDTKHTDTSVCGVWITEFTKEQLVVVAGTINDQYMAILRNPRDLAFIRGPV